MAARQWTVMVMPDGATDVRQFRLSRETVRVTVALALFVFAGLGSLATALLMGAGAGRADSRLLAKNEVLERELELMVARLDTLEGSLEGLSARDAHYRLIAGLEPLGTDVLLAGIGGPDDEDLEKSDVYLVDQRVGPRVFSAGMQVSALLRRANVLASSWTEAEDVLTRKHDRLRAMPSIQPTTGYVSSRFTSSRFHPLLHRARPHTGLDIVAPTGTPVVASANGRVKSAGRNGDYGLLVEIDHGHGITTRYAHLSKTAVKAGDVVERGQRIGAVGSSGLSAGPHLHYEVLVNGRFVNPSRYILENDVIRD